MAGKVAEFVPSDVEGADDHAMRGAAFGHEFVSLVLLVLGRRLGFVEEEEFGAEKTDALRAGGGDGVEFRGQFDIGREDDVLAVARGGCGLADGFELVRDLDLLALDLSVLVAGRLGRIEDELAAVPVEEHAVAGGELRADARQGDDGGDAEGACHDRAVRGAAALLGDETADQRAVDEGGVRRREIARDNDVRTVEAVEVLA